MDRFLLTMLVVATIAVVFLLMAWGWRNGLKRSAHIAMPSEVVDAPIAAGPWEGRFLGTTYAGRWLDRVHAHDLGVRSMVTITVTLQGVNVVRPGARSFSVPMADLVAARADSGIAGRAYETGGIIVVTFRLGDDLLEFGVRFPSTADHLAALAALAPTEVSS